MKDINKEFGPSSWAIDNRTAIYVFTCILCVMGYFSYQGLPKENFPEVIIPKIFVHTYYPGTSPANMEKPGDQATGEGDQGYTWIEKSDI
jgi:multidrug efflux pump